MYHSAYRQYLEQFEAARHFFLAEGDSAATTLGCTGAVILAAALSDSTQVERVRALTGLPTPFVDVVLFSLDFLNLRPGAAWVDLRVTLVERKYDFKDVEEAMFAIVEHIWCPRALTAIPDLHAVLEHLRAGVTFGGAREIWVDPETYIAESDWCQALQG